MHQVVLQQNLGIADALDLANKHKRNMAVNAWYGRLRFVVPFNLFEQINKTNAHTTLS